MKKYLTPVFAIASLLAILVGCATNDNLDKSGKYNGDTYLYNADNTIVNSYNIVDSFLIWELSNNDYIKTNLPDVFAAANKIRKDAPVVLSTISLVRSKYVIAKGSTNQQDVILYSNALSSVVVQLTALATDSQQKAIGTLLSSDFINTLVTNKPALLSEIIPTSK